MDIKSVGNPRVAQHPKPAERVKEASKPPTPEASMATHNKKQTPAAVPVVNGQKQAIGRILNAVA